MNAPHYHWISFRTEEGILVVTITAPEMRGEELCAAIREELLRAVTGSGAKKVVLDFSKVTLVASVAFRPLLSLRRLMQETGGQMVVCALSPLVAEVFYATRLLIHSRAEAPFESQPDIPAAVASLIKKS
jgi:anti-anti-sigma factor